MATNLIRKVYSGVRRIVNSGFIAGKAIQAHRENQRHKANAAYQTAVRTHNQQTKLHQQSVKARVQGVRSAVKSVTKGNRHQRAQQLRSMRSNPAQRAQLRRRVKFKTKMP